MNARKNSKKRQAILEVIRATNEHPSAEWIYARLKPEYSDLSIGTVYRNLALFKKEGEIASVGVVNGQERFDGVTEPHTHFICSVCGSVQDIDIPLPEYDFFRGLCRKAGCELEEFSLSFSGKCSACLNLSGDM